MLNTDFKLCSKLIAVGQHKGKNVTEIILRDSEDLQIHTNWKKKKKKVNALEQWAFDPLLVNLTRKALNILLVLRV